MSVQIYNESFAEICWNMPSSGRTQHYLLSYAPSERSDLTRDTSVPQGANERACYNLTSLEPFHDYWAQVRAHNDGKSGVESRIWFRTEQDGKNIGNKSQSPDDRSITGGTLK